MRVKQKLERILLVAVICFITAVNGNSTGANVSDGVIFYMDFEDSGVAYVKGGLGYAVGLSSGYGEEGRYGRGYRFEPPYENFLTYAQSSPQPGHVGYPVEGFVPGEGANLEHGVEGWEGLGALEAKGERGILWKTVPVELEGIESPHRPLKKFMASVYLYSTTPGARVELELLDEVDGTDWAEPIEAENAGKLKDDPSALVRAPRATVHRPGEAGLSGQWKRVTASIEVDARRPLQKLYLRLSAVSGEGVAAVKASGLQLEQIDRFPHFKDFAGAWIPGGEKRDSNRIQIPVNMIDFCGDEGAMAAWFRLPEPEGGGTRKGPFMSIGGGWWKPIWQLHTGRVYLGEPGKLEVRRYAEGESLIELDFRDARRGGWNHVAAVWRGEECAVYINGEEAGRARYYPAEPQPPHGMNLIVGGTILEGVTTGSAVLDEVAVWNRALGEEEIRILADTDSEESPLGSNLPSELIRVPDSFEYHRAYLFHRGQDSAVLEVSGISRTQAPAGGEALVSAPGAGLEKRVEIPAEGPLEIEIKPWKASPGPHELRIVKDSGAMDSVLPLEIFPSLPDPGFIIRAWDSRELAQEYPFTAAHANRLPEDLLLLFREGRWADLRYDSRHYHPLEPGRLESSLELALRRAGQAAGFPNIAFCMVNTELSRGRELPREEWFMKWMEEETGLGYIPEEVLQGHFLRIDDGLYADEVMRSDDDVYRFARWMRREGKGWPVLHRKVAGVKREAGLDAVFYTDQPETIADIAHLNMVDYWWYPHVPSGLVADFNRVSNLAKLAGGKKVILTPGSFFWDPWPFRVDGKVVTLPPDMLRQYLWLTIAKELDHMGFHGLGQYERGYVFEGAKETLKETLGEVYPAGWLTAGLEAAPRRVAYLATEGQFWLMPGPGGQMLGEMWFNRMASRAIAEAGLQFDWIDDDHVKAGWLDNYDTVVMLGAWVLPEETLGALLGYVKNGGHLVIDEICRADVPAGEVLGITDKSAGPGPVPDGHVKILKDWAKGYVAENPAPARVREEDRAWIFEKVSGEASFIFVVNDLFLPGVLESKYRLNANLGPRTGAPRDRGEPQEVELTLPLRPGYALYDARGRRELEYAEGVVKLELEPGGAALLALLPGRIGAVEAVSPRVIKAGDEGLLDIRVLTEGGGLLGHRSALKVSGEYADGTFFDIPGYYRSEDGRFSVPLRVPVDAPGGPLRIHVEEMISGAARSVSVNIAAGGPAGRR